MPKRKYAIASDGPERLEVEWDGGWFNIQGNIRFLLDGNVIGTVPTPAELKKGYQIELEDGALIEAQLKGRNRIDIIYNGQSLGKLSHPQRLLESIRSELLFLSACSALVGLIAYLDPDYANRPFILIVLTIFPALFLLSRFLIRRFPKPLRIVGAILPFFFITFLAFVDGIRFVNILWMLYFLFRAESKLKEIWKLPKN